MKTLNQSSKDMFAKARSLYRLAEHFPQDPSPVMDANGAYWHDTRRVRNSIGDQAIAIATRIDPRAIECIGRKGVVDMRSTIRKQVDSLNSTFVERDYVDGKWVEIECRLSKTVVSAKLRAIVMELRHNKAKRKLLATGGSGFAKFFNGNGG